MLDKDVAERAKKELCKFDVVDVTQVLSIYRELFCVAGGLVPWQQGISAEFIAVLAAIDKDMATKILAQIEVCADGVREGGDIDTGMGMMQ